MRLFRDEYPSVIPFIVSHTMKDLEKVSHGSNKPVTTVCSAGHTQESQFKLLGRSVAAGRSFCRTCSSRRLFDERPELLPFYRGDAPAETVTAMSTEPVKWEDAEGVRWMTPNHVSRGGARFALDQGLLRPLTLTDAHPTAAQWWSPANTGRPEDCSPRSHVEVSWTCPDAGHTYTAPVYAWARSEGCPVCLGTAVGAGGANSVGDRLPALAAAWSAENEVAPAEVHAGNKGWFLADVPGGGVRWVSPATFSSVEPASTSPLELDVRSRLLRIADSRVIVGDSRLVPGFELDMTCPSRGVAVEVNGVYWHSEEAGRRRSSHFDKSRKCRDAGIRLIHVWEDEWEERPDAVLSYLGQALNSAEDQDYTIAEITPTEGRSFIRANRSGVVTKRARYLAAKAPGGDSLAVLAVGNRSGVPTAHSFCCAGRPVPGALRETLRAAGAGAVFVGDESLAEGQLATADGLVCVRGPRRPSARKRCKPGAARQYTTYDSGRSLWTLP